MRPTRRDNYTRIFVKVSASLVSLVENHRLGIAKGRVNAFASTRPS